MLDNRGRLLAVIIGAVLPLLGLQISLVQAHPVSNPTTISLVTNVNDSGPGSLRNAIGFAQPGDTIQFSLPASSIIILTSGELSVTIPITIDGSTVSSLAIDANHTSRVISATAPLTIRSLSIMNGNATDGGGIYATAALTLNQVVLSGNAATNDGGGVYAASTTTFDGGTLINNTARFGGGAYVLGASTISGTQFYGNVVTNGGGGLLTHAPVSMTLAYFAGNSADNGAGIGTGGGLQAGSNTALLRISQSTFSYNHANGGSDDGGGAMMLYAGTNLDLRDSSLYNNTSASFGGAISSITTTSSITLSNASLYLNSATLSGGAVRSIGPLTLTASHFLTNTADMAAA